MTAEESEDPTFETEPMHSFSTSSLNLAIEALQIDEPTQDEVMNPEEPKSHKKAKSLKKPKSPKKAKKKSSPTVPTGNQKPSRKKPDITKTIKKEKPVKSESTT